MESPGREQVTAGWPWRVTAGCLQRVRDHLHAVRTEHWDGGDYRVADAPRHGGDGVRRAQHPDRDPGERERHVEGPVHADRERERHALVAPPHEEDVEVEPVNMPEGDVMLRFDVTEETRHVEDRGRLRGARRSE